MFEEENEEKYIHTEEEGERTEVEKWDKKEEKERNIANERERKIELERERNTEEEEDKETGSMDSMNKIFSLLQGFASQHHSISNEKSKLFPIILKAEY